MSSAGLGGGSTPALLCTRGLVGRENAKPGVILMRRQSANRPSGVIAFASALAQSAPSRE
jgi:hypothetical protein